MLVLPRRSAAVGFIYGVIVSAASGLVHVIGDFGTRLSYPPAGEDNYLAYDKMEYRFEEQLKTCGSC